MPIKIWKGNKLDKFALFCKSYKGDLDRVLNLVESFEKHNKDNIPFYISVPQEDYELFRNKIPKTITLITDESIEKTLLDTNLGAFSAGYINQQIIKMNFWKTGYAENYLCVDSDSYFIKDFYFTDYMYNEETPYTILYQWEEHFYNKKYIHLAKDYYKFHLDNIKTALNIHDSRYITCCGFAIFSSKVLKSFEDGYLKPNNLTYVDIFKIAPLEFSWYNQWLLKTNTIEIQVKNQLFKIFHYESQYKESRKQLITEEEISEMYLGICMNSNWISGNVPIKYENPNVFFYNLKQKFKIRFYKIFRGILRKVKV